MVWPGTIREDWPPYTYVFCLIFSEIQSIYAKTNSNKFNYKKGYYIESRYVYYIDICIISLCFRENNSFIHCTQIFNKLQGNCNNTLEKLCIMYICVYSIIALCIARLVIFS